ncbi:MAG: RNA pyrophosphohydrolase [Minwuia sp.]|uniref:RNA pyrophosphohydrolase n=1 Tax=Minwuia sp. TaxID=2493630 RepID=UPI003A8C6E93
MTEKTDGLPYRPCAGIMLVNRDWRVFVGQRIDQQVEAWQMPQGGIDKGEDPRTAAFRELEEEVGTAKAELIAESGGWVNYDLPAHLVGKVWKGRFRGQAQKWFLLRFTGEDTDIDIETDHPEFETWRWARLSELVDMAIEFKRDTYRQVVAEFAPHFPEEAR